MFNFFKRLNPSDNKRKYSFKADLPDIRDFNYSDFYSAPVTSAMHSLIDLRPLFLPVQDQGNLGSCTSFAITGALEALEKIDNKPQNKLSELFVYYNERTIEGTINYDSGATLRDGIKSLVKFGTCNESLWPYAIKKYTKKPTLSAYLNGKSHLITSYYRLNTLVDIQNCLKQGYPFVLGIAVYESFESDSVSQTGIVPMPGPNESCLGGHAVCCCGIDLNKKVCIVRNSWTSGWGDKGYFYLPIDYVTNSNLTSDMWTVRKGINL
jgi:C1A family cysteine protease